MDIITYALCKKMVAAAASGISDIKVEGQNLIFTTSTGEEITVTLPPSETGIVKIEIDENNNLIYTMADGSTVNVGTLAAEITEEQLDAVAAKVYAIIEENYPTATVADIDALFDGQEG